MTRLKKIFASMLLVLVTVCSLLGSAVLNITRSIFTLGNAKAEVVSIPGNKNTSTTQALAGDVISIPAFSTSVKKNANLVLPFGNVQVTDHTNLTAAPQTIADLGYNKLFVEITDIYGQALTEYDDTNGTQVTTAGVGQVTINAGTLTLTPANAGNYRVKYYVLSNSVWTSTDAYDIEVASESYSMKFVTDGATVMPSTFNYTKAQTIDIALPLLYDEDGKLIENEDILLGGQYGSGTDTYYYILRYEDVAGTDGVRLNNVSKINDTTNIYKEYKTYTVKKVTAIPAELKYALYVDLTSSSLNMNNYDSTTRLNLSNVTTTASAYDLHPFSFDTTEALGGGKYVVTYNMYKVNAGAVAATPDSYLNYTITGSASFDQDGISLIASTSSNVKRSDVSYKEKHYLPSVNALNTNENNTSVNAFYYYTIQVQDGEESKSTADYVTMGRDENGFYFVPNAVRGSTYEIAYEVVDAFANTAEDSNKDNYYTVQIYDDSYPVAVYTKAFNAADLDQADPSALENYKDYSYVIPTKYEISSNTQTRQIRIPALAVADYSGVREVTRSLSSDKFIKNAAGETADTTQYLTITSNTGLPTAPSNVNPDVNLRQYLMFENNAGKLIDSQGYYINADLDYVDADGNVVPEADKVFAFKDDQGANLTGTALRDALNSCEAIITLRNDVFAAGTYTLTMRVQEEGQNKVNTNREKTITLYDDGDITPTTPSVEFSESKIVDVTDNQTILVPVPTAKDDTDKNLLVRYFVDVEGAAELIEVYPNEEGKYLEFNTADTKDSANHSVFELASTSADKSFKVVAFAFSDFAKTEQEIKTATAETTFEKALTHYDSTNATFAYIGYDSYKITVKSNVADAIPTITQLPTYTAMVAPTQYEEYQVSGFKFKDDTNTAQVEVSVTDTKGNSYAYSTLGGMTITYDGTNYVYNFPGIKFLPSNADDENYYTITYTISDNANNVVNHSFVLIHATDEESPTISGLTGSSDTLELGEVYYFSKLTATDNTAGDITFSATVTDSEGNDFSTWFNPSRKTFSPKAEGTYTIRLVATDSADNASEPKEFTITVKDTLAPRIEYVELDAGMSEEILVPESSITTTGGTTTYPEVKLPRAYAQDQWSANASKGLVRDTSKVTITISAPTSDSDNVKEYSFDAQGNIQNNVTNTLNLRIDGNYIFFTPTARGQYTITYSAQDAAGNNASSKVISVSVGDTEQPQIVLTEAFKKTLTDGFVVGDNDTLVINNNAIVYDNTKTIDYETLSSMYVKDNAGFDATHDADLDVDTVSVNTTITDANGSTITATASDDNLLHYEFTTSGTYTLTLTVNDKVGNKYTLTKTFTVSTKESSQKDSSTIIGIVLIVVSALILAGVIVYFIRGTKMLPKKKAQKTTKKED